MLRRSFRKSPADRRGIAIILTALMLTWVIPIVGLAIDAGVLFAMKAKVSAACDAASMAAARSLAKGQTLAAQTANATSRAQAFFYANYPNGTLDSSVSNLNVAVGETDLHTRTVTVDAEIAAPVYFMRVLGVNSLTVRASATSSRRDVNVMLVLDRSGSLTNAGACDDLESAATAFSDMFANMRDRLGLITYGGGSRVDYAPSMYFKSSPALNDKLALLDPNGCTGWTGSAAALWQGYQQLVNLNEPGALNVILFFTDGQPNAVTAEWNVKTQSTSTWPTGKSRCWDWGNNKRYDQAGWNPSTQKYLGWVAASDQWRDGIYQMEAPQMPVAEDRILQRFPVAYSGTAKPTSDDCYYAGSPMTGSGVYDIPYYPDEDYYGNSLFGFKSVQTYPGGHPYAGKIQTSDTATGINAAVNALDNAAQRIRNRALDANLAVVIYAVGLGGAGAAEHELLRRVANDPASPIYDESKPHGIYIYSPNAAQLNQAFARIGGEILRFSK